MARIVKTLVVAATLMAALLASSAAAACTAGTETPDGCINVIGGSGWIEFCSGNSTSSKNSNCMRMRPFGFLETDSSNSVVNLGNGGQKKRINNLGGSLTAGSASMASAPLCTNSTPAYTFCGRSEYSYDALNYTSVPMTVSLSALGGGTLTIEAMIFRSAGWFSFDGHNVSVAAGDFKFNVGMTGYTFASNGAKIRFQLTVKKFGSTSEEVSVRNLTNGGSTVDGAMTNLPRFAYRSSATADYAWADVSVNSETSGSNTVLVYNFAGPFTSMIYDPTVVNPDSEASSSSPSAALGTAAAVLASAAVAFFAL